jgi:hypothetical protein
VALEKNEQAAAIQVNRFLVMSTGYGQMPHFMDVLKCGIDWAAKEATVRKPVGRLPRIDVEVI